MNEDQLYDAAEREMDLYRAEITRITEQRDEYRDNAVLHVRERDEARGAISDLLGMFRGISGGYGARTSSSRLRKIAARAGVHWDGLTLPAPDTTEAAETQRLRELVAEMLADFWPGERFEGISEGPRDAQARVDGYRERAGLPS